VIRSILAGMRKIAGHWMLPISPVVFFKLEKNTPRRKF
jgi:hypothetical protein